MIYIGGENDEKKRKKNLKNNSNHTDENTLCEPWPPQVQRPYEMCAWPFSSDVRSRAHTQHKQNYLGARKKMRKSKKKEKKKLQNPIQLQNITIKRHQTHNGQYGWHATNSTIDKWIKHCVTQTHMDQTWLNNEHVLGLGLGYASSTYSIWEKWRKPKWRRI